MIDIAMYHARIGTFQVPGSKIKKKKRDDKVKLSGVSIYIQVSYAKILLCKTSVLHFIYFFWSMSHFNQIEILIKEKWCCINVCILIHAMLFAPSTNYFIYFR